MNKTLLPQCGQVSSSERGWSDEPPSDTAGSDTAGSATEKGVNFRGNSALADKKQEGKVSE